MVESQEAKALMVDLERYEVRRKDYRNTIGIMATILAARLLA